MKTLNNTKVYPNYWKDCQLSEKPLHTYLGSSNTTDFYYATFIYFRSGKEREIIVLVKKTKGNWDVHHHDLKDIRSRTPFIYAAKNKALKLLNPK